MLDTATGRVRMRRPAVGKHFTRDTHLGQKHARAMDAGWAWLLRPGGATVVSTYEGARAG